MRKAEEEIYLTEQSLKELLEGKIIYDDDGRIRLYPPKTNELGIMRTKEKKRDKTFLNIKAVNGELTVEEVLSYMDKKVKDIETGEIYTVVGIYNAYDATVDLENENGSIEDVWVGELELI